MKQRLGNTAIGREQISIRRLRNIFGRRVAEWVRYEPVWLVGVHKWVAYCPISYAFGCYVVLPYDSFATTRDDGSQRPTTTGIRNRKFFPHNYQGEMRLAV